MLADYAVLIADDRVKAVGSAADLAKSLPAGTTVIDLGDVTILPGLIDCHTHVTGQPENFYEDIFRKSPIDEATTSHIYAKRTLDAGFTTIRNVGADNYTGLRAAQRHQRGQASRPAHARQRPRAQRHRRPWRP